MRAGGSNPDRTTKGGKSWLERLMSSDPFFSLEAFPLAVLAKWVLIPVLILSGVILLLLLLLGNGLS